MTHIINHLTNLTSAPISLLAVQTFFVAYKERALLLLGHLIRPYGLFLVKFPTLDRESPDYTFPAEDKKLEPTRLYRYGEYAIHSPQKREILPTNWHRTGHCAQQKHRP